MWLNMGAYLLFDILIKSKINEQMCITYGSYETWWKCMKWLKLFLEKNPKVVLKLLRGINVSMACLPRMICNLANHWRLKKVVLMVIIEIDGIIHHKFVPRSQTVKSIQ